MSKITKSTFKAFIRKANGKLHIRCCSSFDGMTDCIQPTGNKEFRLAEMTDKWPEHSLGVNGLWLVGNSRDYFTPYDDGQYAGIEVSNCCGHQIIAVPKA